jgi:hypothetical protein
MHAVKYLPDQEPDQEPKKDPVGIRDPRLLRQSEIAVSEMRRVCVCEKQRKAPLLDRDNIATVAAEKLKRSDLR